MFLGVLSVSSGYLNNSNINKAEEIWGELKGQSSERAYILNSIYSGIGYGGMIHEFKNYVIRGDSGQWDRTHVSFGNIRALISQYQSLPLSKQDIEFINPIKAMVYAYEKAIHKVSNLKKEGYSIEEIDRMVKVSDAAALSSLSRFSAVIQNKKDYANKQFLLNKLKIEIGYGGMIHKFKNYILRADNQDMKNAVIHSNNAQKIIKQYYDLNLTYREELNLSTISDMVASYASMLDDVKSMHESNTTLSNIDDSVKYDDYPALRAFSSLQKEIIKENTNSSKNLIKVLNDVHFITTSTGYVSVFIILSLILFMVKNYYSRILEPISKITANMKELAEGEINESLPAPRFNDEISEMIRSIEVFRRQTQDIHAAEKRFELLFDASPFGMIAVSERGEIIMANIGAVNIFGYSQSELLDVPLENLVPVASREGHSVLRKKFHKAPSSKKMGGYRELYATHKSGKLIPVEISLNPIDLIGERLVLCAINDISIRKEAELELQKLSKSVDRSPNLVLITDANGLIEYVNNSFTVVTGYTQAELIGKTPNILSSGETAPECYEELWETILAGNEWRGELLNKKKNNEFFWASHLVFPITNDAGEITNFVSLCEDISESKKVSDELEYRADHDLLTGLKSRHSFESRLSSVLAKPHQLDQTCLAEGSVCFIDLDQFKVINDTSGHVAGDELLKKVALLLLSKVRKDDLVARFGGDEFIILMENCPAEKSIGIAEEIRASLERIGFNWEGVNYSTTCSIGIAHYGYEDECLTEIMKRVDAACYVAKDNGRNMVYAALDADDDIANRQSEMHWLSDIALGLTEDRFKLYVQRILPVNCCGEGGREYEVLIRYQDNNGAIIPPGAFLPAAERYQKAEKIDLWVITTLFQWFSEHRAELSHIGSFAINLSGQSLGSNEILETITNGLKTFKIPPSLIKFEVTETAAISNLDQAIKFIKAIKSYGCKFSLDDFGSGLSSFAYLKSLPVDTLKIDGMFVKNILDDKVDFAMVKMINEIGHVMGMKTIAEFVENDEILATIGTLGVNYAQGYGVEKPIPINEIRRPVSIILAVDQVH